MKTLFTTGQVAKYTEASPRTVCKWVDTGRLKGNRLPGSQDRRIHVEDLVSFMTRNGLRIPKELAARYESFKIRENL